MGVARLSSRLFSISSRARSLPGKSDMDWRPWASRLECGKALVRIEDVALHVGCFSRPPPKLVHRPHEAHPVQDLLLAAVLDGAQRPLPPRRVIAGLQRVVERSIGLDIRIEQV